MSGRRRRRDAPAAAPAAAAAPARREFEEKNERDKRKRSNRGSGSVSSRRRGSPKPPPPPSPPQEEEEVDDDEVVYGNHRDRFEEEAEEGEEEEEETELTLHQQEERVKEEEEEEGGDEDDDAVDDRADEEEEAEGEDEDEEEYEEEYESPPKRRRRHASTDTGSRSTNSKTSTTTSAKSTTARHSGRSHRGGGRKRASKIESDEDEDKNVGDDEENECAPQDGGRGDEEQDQEYDGGADGDGNDGEPVKEEEEDANDEDDREVFGNDEKVEEHEGDGEDDEDRREDTEAAAAAKDDEEADAAMGTTTSARASARASANASVNASARARRLSSPLRAINRAGRPPEAGIIKRVHVENFMCHRKLTVDLNRHVNFINGQNGSGKSAILAAIQICLGAGARRTHRARNLKELIRQDSDGTSVTSARVRVSLWNEGDDGYKTDLYGPVITVERTISKAGGYNGYKLLDEHMQEQSRSKKDLDAMLDQLNIQVENPVAVLDQEEAKKFLTGKAQDKYNFFSKATELERLDRTYASILDTTEDLIVNKERISQGLQPAADAVRELKREWEQFQALSKLEEKLAESTCDYSWAMVAEFSAEADDAKEKLDKCHSKIAKKQQELTNFQTGAEGESYKQEQERLQEQMNDLTTEANDASEQKRGLETELKHAEAPLRRKERERGQIVTKKKQAERALKEAQNRLQAERQRLVEAEGSAQSDAARRTKAMQEAEQELAEVKEEFLTVKQSVADHQRKYTELEPLMEQSKQNVDGIKRQVGGVENRLRDLKTAANDSMASYGQKCRTLFGKIHQMKSAWQGPVVGPIGAHVKIAPGKDEYAAVAEKALGGGLLDRFIVTNDADRKKFQQLREQVGCKSRECGILQMTPCPRYDIPDPPSSEVETVASVLQIDNDLVFNCLVDNARMDTKALGRSKESTERALLVRDEGSGRNKIRGIIKEVYCLPHGDFWKVAKGSLTIISNENRLKQTIGVDKSGAIRVAQQELEQLQGEKAEHEKRLDEVRSEVTSYQRQWSGAKKKQRQLQTRQEQLESELERLRHEMEEATQDMAADTTEFEEDVASAQTAVEDFQERLHQTEQDKEALLPAVDEVKRRLEEVTARNEKILGDLAKAEASLTEFMNTLAQREEMIRSLELKLTKFQEVKEKIEIEFSKAQDNRDKALEAARVLQYRRNEAQKRKEEDEQRQRRRQQRQQQQHEDGGAEEGENDALISSTAETPNTLSLEDIPPEELEAIEVVRVNKDSKYYKAKMERQRKKVEEEKERRRMEGGNDDPMEAYEKFMRAKADVEAKLAQVEQIEENTKRLQADLKARKRLWKQFRKHLVATTNQSFDEFLNQKGSSGSLEFDHSDRTLNLVVQKDNKDANSQTKDVKALSGGERSYTTLSLLLALGERLETPFRVMDEFDVFLDPISRKLALKTMVHMATTILQHRQFIFITPQDLSSMTASDMVRIYKLKPPARNTVVDGLSQQTL